MLIILHLNLKKHHIFLDGLLLDIKQWGSFSGNGNGFEVNFPISFTQNCYGIASSDTGDVCLAIGIKLLNLNSIQIFGRNLDGTFRTDSNIRCIMVGK